MEFDRRLVRLLADLENEAKRERVSIERDRRIFTAVDQQVRDLVVTLRRFDEADEHNLFEVEELHRGRGGRKLSLAAVDKDELRQRRLLLDRSPIASKDGLVHRRKIVRSLDGLDDETPICGTRGLTVLENDDARDILRTGNIRDVEGLDPLGEMREFENLLQLFKHLCRVGFEHAETLLKSDPRVRRNKIDEMAFGADLRVKDVNAAAAALGQSLFENAAILEIYRHVYLERNVVGRVILSQNLAEKFACVERVIFDEVFPKEFAAADDLAFAHREKLKRKPLFLAVETEDVDVLLGG